jgi:hypothetical protein
MPLTFEAKVANSNVKLTLSSHAIVNSIEYSTDGGGSWQPYTSATDITLANVGDKVQFRGTATTYNSSNFSSNSGELYAYGNVMSLLYGSDFANKTAFPNESQYTFCNLFNSMSNLYNHPALTFALPATTLVSGCYNYMFYGCSNLRSVVCLATTNINTNTCRNWLNGVAATGTFTKAAGVTWTTGASGIPTDWTIVVGQ